jgi:fimbrial isopeptide formation D2 family protein/uncharacterized repeat protein (TIGR01451 family)
MTNYKNKVKLLVKKAMKTNVKKQIFRARGVALFLFLAISVLITLFPGTASAKSLYVLDKGSDYSTPWLQTPLQAYNIGTDGTLTLQKETEIPHWSGGPLELTVDSDSGTLFLIYESDSIIFIVDAVTMENTWNMALVPDLPSLIGITYDHQKKMVYCTDKGKNTLYGYKWDPVANTLTADANYPVHLENATAYGIAIDEIDGVLYVANSTNKIYAYKTSDWTLERTITLSRTAESISLDVPNGYLYAGGGKAGNNYLIQYRLATNTEKEVKVADDAGVIGLCVDSDTGNVYISTGNAIRYDIESETDSNDLLIAYDKTLNKIDTVKDPVNPSGVAIPGKDIGYNPLNLSKKATGGVTKNVETGFVQLDDQDGYITYTIYFDSIDINVPLTDVVLIDRLPSEVTFVSADDSSYGKYDAEAHTYTWVYSAMKARVSKTLALKVKVNNGIPTGTIISNYATINSNETPPTTVKADIIKPIEPLYIKKSVFGTADGIIKKVDPGEVLRYRIYFNTTGKSFTSTGITIIDKLPQELTFISADYDSKYGNYNSNTHTYRWSYPDMKPNTSAYVDMIVKVKSDIAPGTTITNTVTIDCDQTSSSSSSVSVVVNVNTLNISKTVNGAYFDGSVFKVAAEETVTYVISYDSNEGSSFTNVTIVDTLPEQVTFVSADADGIAGSYDANTRTYTWSYSHVDAGTTKSLQLKAKIKKDVAIGTAITNTVVLTCNEAPSTSDSVEVVIRQAQLKAASLTINPNTLRRVNGTAKTVTAVLQLPKGYAANDVKNTLLVLNYGSSSIKATSQQISNTSNGAKITAVFDKSAILNAISGYGQFKVTAIGTLQSGQDFYGEQNIWITRFTGY